MKFRPPNRLFAQAYRRFLYRVASGMVLLLTSRGRKTGRLHTVGLQYELIDGDYWVGAADGVKADWYRNILRNPQVEVQVGSRKFPAHARVISDPEQLADFLQYRLQKHPLMLRLILRAGGLRGKLDRERLVRYAEKLKAVVLSPD